MRRACVRMGVLAVAVGVVSPAAAQEGPPAKVVLAEVLEQEIAQQREVTGDIRARLRSSIASQVEGAVVGFDLKEGDAVQAGQVIARLDDMTARLEVRRAEARAASARALIAQRDAELEDAEADLARLEELQREGTIAPPELDAGRIRVRSEAARLAQAKADLDVELAQLALAEDVLADMQIVAPFAGRVVQTFTEVGQWLDRGDAVATVVSVDRLEAWVDVPEAFVGELAPAGDGQTLRVPVRMRGSGLEIAGELIGVVPEADELSRLFPVRLGVPSLEGRIKPGMSVVAVVPTGQRQPTLTIPKDAVLRNDVGEFVYFDAGGVAGLAPIRRLFAIGDRVAIRRGQLQAGMQVIVQGNERLMPGTGLQVLDAISAGAADGQGGAAGPASGQGG